LLQSSGNINQQWIQYSYTHSVFSSSCCCSKAWTFRSGQTTAENWINGWKCWMVR
jgi:hypothetical protein